MIQQRHMEKNYWKTSLSGFKPLELFESRTIVRFSALIQVILSFCHHLLFKST